MNKKILILPLVVTTLGLTSCKKKDDTVTDATTIATQMYEASVASAKKLKTFQIDTNVSSSKMNSDLQIDVLQRKSEKDPYVEFYETDLSDLSLQSNLKIGGLTLQSYNDPEDPEIAYNQKLKGHVRFTNVSTKGTIDYSNKRHSTKEESDNGKCTVSFNKTDTVDSLNAYIDRVDDYNAYVNFGTLDNQLEKLEYDFHGSKYGEREKNIQSKINGLIELIRAKSYAGRKRYIGISSFKEYPLLEWLIEVLSEKGLGSLGDKIVKYANGEEKEASIKKIKEYFVDVLNNDSHQYLKMTTNDNKNTFTLALGYNELNQLYDINKFYNGTINVTISTDDSKCITSFSIEVNGLKTSKWLDLPEIYIGEDPYFAPHLYFDDFNIKINSSVSYGFDYNDFADVVDREVDDYMSFDE